MALLMRHWADRVVAPCNDPEQTLFCLEALEKQRQQYNLLKYRQF
jgi:hypothetical protein